MHQKSEVSLVHNCHLPSVFPTTTFFYGILFATTVLFIYNFLSHLDFSQEIRVSGTVNSILLTFGHVPNKGGAFSKNLVKLISAEVYRKLKSFLPVLSLLPFILLTSPSKRHVLSKLLMKLESALNE